MKLICFAGWHEGYPSSSLERPFWIFEAADVQACRFPGQFLLGLMYCPTMHEEYILHSTNAHFVQYVED